MGVVYRARDERLGRTVAIKALPEELASDPGRLERFEREARLLAQLNHPNIAGIHGLEEHGGGTFLVLEFVEGETLAERLDRGPLDTDEAVRLGVQIASGVQAAHDAGVVHRDLKPANIIVTPEGDAKVLDFGLAKAGESQSSTHSGFSQSPTMTSPERGVGGQHSPTIPGAILGTAAYMSPEQARGRRVDHRTDVWSFGVVLYEMLCGASPFVGETASDSIGAVLHKEFNLDRLPDATPANVRRVLRRCLQRDRDLRYHSLADARLELLSTSIDDAAEPGAESDKSRAAGLLVGVLAILLVGALVVIATMWTARPESTPALPLRVALDAPEDARVMFKGDLSGPPAVSPDGRHIAFVAQRQNDIRRLWVRAIDEADPREIPGTENALFPFWSPDSTEIGFFTPSQLKRMDLASETVQNVCDVDHGRGAAWTEDGRIVYSRNFRDALWIVSARGGEGEPLTTLDEDLHTSHRWPDMIPGTNQYIFSAVSARVGARDLNAIYLADLDSEAPPRRLMPSNYLAKYHDGHILHVRDNVLLASPVDLDSAEVLGNPRVVLRDLNPDLSTWHGQFSISREGTLAYHRERAGGSDEDVVEGYSWATEGDRITAMNEDGRITTSYAQGMAIHSITLSPDGSKIAMGIIGSNGFPDIWIQPTAYLPDPTGHFEAGGSNTPGPLLEASRLTALPGAEMMPVWAPGSDEVAFRWDGGPDRPGGHYRKRLGGGSEQLIAEYRDQTSYATQWTPDGEFLIVVEGSILTSDENDLYAIPVEGGEWIPLVTEPGADASGSVSPDGRWLVHANVQDASSNIYVSPFAPAWPDGNLNRKWLVSDNGGYFPAWSPEGDEIFYISPTGVLISVAVDGSGEDFVHAPPVARFQTPWEVGRTFGVAPDSTDGPNGFVFVDSEVDAAASISLILNWPALLDAADD